MDGIVLLLSALVLACVPALLPPWMFARFTVRRAIVLGLACTWWTLAQYGVWKLATVESSCSSRRKSVSRIIRAGAVSYFLVPALIELHHRGFPDEIGRPLIIAAVLGGGIVVAVAPFLLLGCLSRSVVGHITAAALGLAALVWFWLLVWSGGHGGTSSLDWLFGLPILTLPPEALHWMIREPDLYFEPRSLAANCIAAYAVATLAFLISWLAIIWSAKTRHRARGESSRASSHP